MPDINIDLTIEAPIERTWNTILDVERYPESMETVRYAGVVGRMEENRRRVRWSVLLKGSILEWEEEEKIDSTLHRVEFKQLQGDLEDFDGEWSLEAVGAQRTRVLFRVAFEIGIPMLAEMLNPVAQRSLRENSIEMLRGIERASAVG